MNAQGQVSVSVEKEMERHCLRSYWKILPSNASVTDKQNTGALIEKFKHREQFRADIIPGQILPVPVLQASSGVYCFMMNLIICWTDLAWGAKFLYFPGSVKLYLYFFPKCIPFIHKMIPHILEDNSCIS